MGATERNENLKIHSVRYILKKLKDNVPNEEFRRKIISSNFVANTALFDPLPTLKPEINNVYELVLFNQRIDTIIDSLDDKVKGTTQNYEDARLAWSETFAVNGLEEAMAVIPLPSDQHSSFYSPVLSYFKTSLSNPYQFSIRLKQLGKRIEELTRHTEDNRREQKWYLHPTHFNRLITDRRDLYDKLLYDHHALTEILQKLEP